MRRLLLALGLALAVLLGAGPSRAQERPADLAPADRAAIEGVIARQIEAFRRDDGDTAFGLASPGIQGLFLTADRFMAMVRGGYAPVYRPREFRFARLRYVGDMLVQFVAIIGPDGAPVVAAYTMEQQADGSWRIQGNRVNGFSDSFRSSTQSPGFENVGNRRGRIQTFPKTRFTRLPCWRIAGCELLAPPGEST